MDFDTVVQQMRLDRLAVDASKVLTDRHIPHALLKGPTTARWLYNPPRRYRDVDLLVPYALVEQAAAQLARAGLASADNGRIGEQASHSLLMHTSTGLEIDLHLTLPMLQVHGADDGKALWRAVSPRIVPFVLDGTPVPSLDAPGRLLVLALHALGNGPADEVAREDLRLAVAASSCQDRTSAADFANCLNALPQFLAGLTLVEGGPLPKDLPPDARARLEGASGVAFQLARLSRTPRRQLPGLLLREAFPTAAFLRHDDPALPSGPVAVMGAHVRRWRRLAVELRHELPGRRVRRR